MFQLKSHACMLICSKQKTVIPFDRRLSLAKYGRNSSVRKALIILLWEASSGVVTNELGKKVCIREPHHHKDFKRDVSTCPEGGFGYGIVGASGDDVQPDGWLYIVD